MFRSSVRTTHLSFDSHIQNSVTYETRTESSKHAEVVKTRESAWLVATAQSPQPTAAEETARYWILESAAHKNEKHFYNQSFILLPEIRH